MLDRKPKPAACEACGASDDIKRFPILGFASCRDRDACLERVRAKDAPAVEPEHPVYEPSQLRPFRAPAVEPEQPRTLATPCAGCGHTYNWHRDGRCTVTAGPNGCGCGGFTAFRDEPERSTDQNMEHEPEQPTYPMDDPVFQAGVIGMAECYRKGQADERARIRRIVEDAFFLTVAQTRDLLGAIDGGDDA